MASTFKRRYLDRKGETVECKTYTVAFNDCSDPSRGVAIVRQVSGFTHKGASEELGNNLEKLAKLRAAGEPMDEKLRLYTEHLPAKLREKLAGWGLLSPIAEAAKKAILQHVAAYEQALRDGVASRKQKGRPATPQHVKDTGNRIRTLIKLMGSKSLGDITVASVARAIRGLEVKGVRTKGISSKTRHHYVSSIWAFLAWCVREHLIHANPLDGMAKPDPALERRHLRRHFEPDEIRRLLDAAQSGPTRLHMTGEQRYWLYRFAAETGIRSGEIRRLLVKNLALDGPKPCVTVPATVAKSRRERVVPLKVDTATGLKAILKGKHPAAPIFKMPRPESVVIALRADLAVARAAWIKEAETPEGQTKREGTKYLEPQDEADRYLDFHSLRLTFATNLIAAGVDVKTAQELLGHATPAMTLGLYAKVLRGSQENAIARMPSYGGTAEPEQLRATGTCDCRENCTSAVATDSASVPSHSTKNGTDASVPLSVSPGLTSDLRASKLQASEGRITGPIMTPTGFEPVLPA